MILNRTWNKKEQKLIISYLDKDCNRQFYQKYFHHIKTYEYDVNGEFETWNGKRCRAVYKDTTTYVPSEFDLLEFMYELPTEINKELHAQRFPKIYTFDIETEYVKGVFPDPETAEHRVNSISLVGPDLSCIVYGLHNLNDDSKLLFKNRYLDWIENNQFAKKILNGRTPKVLYQYFRTEEELLKHFFNVIISKTAVLAGWNTYNFDWTYLVNRIKRLFGNGEMYNMIRKASPTGETCNISYEAQVGNTVRIISPAHTEILDYMLLVKKYDRKIAPQAESFSLDWIGSHAVDAHKIEYDGDLDDLYHKDPEWYYFYNAVDSLIVMLIHYKLKAIEPPCAVDSVTLVPLRAAMGQVSLTTANVFEEFYKDGKKVVWDYDAVERYKKEYEGAFCACVPGRYEWNVCDDFASLYPSQVQTCNLSFENFLTPPPVGPDSLGRYIPRQWTPQELEEFRKDPNYFVSIMGNVYKNDKEYAFKRMQRRIKQMRDIYKYTGQKIESELLTEIDRLIKEKS